jgi:oxygen-dependent protoporphyrinogen oxidase
MKNNQQIIVVGAGIAGLVAAYELQKAGIQVIILESSHKSGGRMVTERINNSIIDTGAQFLSSGYPIISSLIKELNIESHFRPTSPHCSIIKNGKIHTFRYDNPFSLLFSGLLGFKDWLRFGMNGKKLYNATKTIPVNNFSAWHQFDNQHCFEWSSDYYGTRITEYIIEPMLEAFYFQQPRQTSKALAIALNTFGNDKSKTMTLAGGIALLPARLSEKLNIIYDSPVEEIVMNHQSVSIKTAEQEYRSQKIILATPAPVAAKIFGQANKQEKKLLATQYSSTLNITLGLKKPLSSKKLSRTYGFWIPAVERKNIAAIAIESNKNNDRVSTGELLNIMLSGRAGKEMLQMEKEEILDTIFKELKPWFPNISEHIAFTRITRWPYAEPMSPIGRSKNINTYREAINNKTRIFLAGDYMGMPFTEGAAETGKWAATQVILAEQ